MFKLAKEPQFTHDVPVQVPVDGGHEAQTLKARFRVIADDAAEEFDVSTTDGLKDFLRAAVVRIDDIVDEANDPVVWSADLFEELLNLAYVRIGLWNGYIKGLVGARLGN
ncbi:hypothetical protein [Acidimangrovimonas sediminis]|uniref:hypothetical protein n=1 Tax=Acidimangrovimonas sediminis TaxID=2056283 RepID=UPI000C7FD8DF|nr:hypothetical protein [Acidimangrovimonas sediminis]